MSSTRRSSKGGAASVVLAVLFVVLAGLLWLNRQTVVDHLNVWQYQPSEEVAGLASRASMNDSGTFIFYTGRPSIEDAGSFNQKCTRKEANSAVLGCYNGQNIFIYNVKDSRLDGIREVTAAHEMLHAVYIRLTDTERARVDDLLAQEYEKLKDRPEFAERMAFYERTEPGERNNELHSIIATEVSSIGTELETYYARYFSDRTQVIALYEKYAAVFSGLQERGELVKAQLARLAGTIEAETDAYNKDVSKLNQDIANFNARANAGDFSSDAAFQAERNSLINRAKQLDSRRASISASISEYNQLREELAALATESEAINRSIDSSLAPAPSL